MSQVRCIKANIPVLFFKEDDKYVAYSRALDLSTCGDTEKDAWKMFREALGIFLAETTKMGTLAEVMDDC